MKPITIKDKIKTVKLSEIKPCAHNSKNHNKQQIELVKKSIQRNEYVQPIAIWKDNTIVAGHCRYLAIKQMAKESKTKDIDCEVVDCSHLTEIEAEELRVLDNKSNESAWDKKNLAISFEKIFKGVEVSTVDVSKVGFSINEVMNLLPQSETKGDDNIPDDVEKTTKLNDLWELGKHRVLCGDSTKEEDVNRLMDGSKADMVFTDPPYGVSYADKNKFLNNNDKGNRIQDEIKNDHLKLNDYKELWLNAFKCFIPNLSEYSSYYICSPQGGDLFMMMMMIKESGLQLKHQIIWAKNNHVLGRSDYNYKHEPIFYGWHKRHRFYGNGSQKFSLWNYNKPLKNDLHPTMKPVELILNAVLNSTKTNNIVYDCFLGSGSTLVSCEKTNRICYGLELDEHYTDVIVKRYITWMIANNKEDKISIKRNNRSFDYKQFLEK